MRTRFGDLQVGGCEQAQVSWAAAQSRSAQGGRSGEEMGI